MKGIDKTNLPKHIAITMDGNGRWAKTKGIFTVLLIVGIPPGEKPSAHC